MSHDGTIVTTDADMEVLAEFEEEQERKGNFELLFPTQKTIEEYRGYFSQQRRANLVLWAYIKQGMPIHHVQNYYKFKLVESHSGSPGI